jgi:predicted flap endonuclease-1-like 5' DNA nuclease
LATARQLRAIGVTSVSDLLSLSSDTTAALLAHLPINGAIIRRWQAEARLMCRIPRLRAYDARMLVACGITDPRELERMAPDELRGIVRRFLATEEGDRMARSGSDQELSRVKKWIRSAKHASLRRDAESSDRAQRGQGSTGKMRRRRKRRTATAERRHASWTPRVVGQDISPTDQPPMDQPPTDQPPTDQPVAASAASHSASAVRREDKTGETRSRRFYLEPSSSAEAAPSIGPKTAERLAAIGVHTVIDLLKIVPEDAAVELGNRRIKPDTIRDWQAQATLVCRVPHLRGHDAQILVACGVREPEQLAAQNPHELFAKVDPFVTTREGERIVRAGKKPDLAEVTDWIEWAKHPRPLRAA